MSAKSNRKFILRSILAVGLCLSAIIFPSSKNVAYAGQINGESQVFVAKQVCATWSTGVETETNCWYGSVGDVEIEGWNEYDSPTKWGLSTTDLQAGPSDWWWKIEKGVTVRIREAAGWETAILDTDYPMNRQAVLITFTCNYWNSGFTGCDASYTTSNS